MGKPKISRPDGQRALELWEQGGGDDASVALAVRYCLQELSVVAPGSSVEVRVPPFGAVQVIAGPSHTRGTPPAVVEMSPEVWLRVATGLEPYLSAVEQGRVSASGQRSDLSAILPVAGLR